MKINELKINSYGNLKNKNIDFKDGINIVYGENEKGKSTLLNCIVNFLYGTSKNKKGRNISDYDKYKPWDTEEFSGKMKYTLDNGKAFEIYREFGKKSVKLYNSDMEEISKNYTTDKTAGNQFFFDQTKVDENMFSSTMVSYQNEVEIDSQTQNVLLQKIANTSSTGGENISYKKAIEKLNKRQLDEIGTNRSQGKPINIILKEIDRLTSESETLKNYENYNFEIEEKINTAELDYNKYKIKGEFLNKLNNINQQQSIENEKLKYSESKIDDIENKIQVLMSQKDEIQSKEKSVNSIEKHKVNIIPYVITVILSAIISVGVYILSKNIFSLLILLVAIFAGLLLFFKLRKVSSINKNITEKNLTYNRQLEKNIYEINAQIELLEKNKNEQIKEAELIKNETLKKIYERIEQLKLEYEEKIDSSTIDHYINSNNLAYEINQNARAVEEKNMEMHRLNLDKENILPKLEMMANNEELISNYKEQYDELMKKSQSINIAKEVIEIAYHKMKSDVTPRFTEKLSQNVSIITNNKYRRLIINEDDGIMVELQNGEYKSANLLSKGTIEQIYLAFRLSLIEDISDESMPIIFDEIFAYADDFRLRDTLKNISENYSKNHQIILLTCTNREETALNSMGIQYNKIAL